MTQKIVEYCDVCSDEIVTTKSKLTGRTRKGRGVMAIKPSWRRRFVRWLLGGRIYGYIVDDEGYRSAHICDTCRREIAEIVNEKAEVPA